MLDVAPQKPLRADEPVTQNDELGLRRVTASNQTGAAGIETRVRFWNGLAAVLHGQGVSLVDYEADYEAASPSSAVRNISTKFFAQ